MGSENLHEDPTVLSDETKDMHRAIVSLMEELEAVDWYRQRAEACTDDELRAVLTHNKNEEIEHAMMNLEWIRRNDATFAENVETYIGSKGPITSVEASTKEGGEAPSKGGAKSKEVSTSKGGPSGGSAHGSGGSLGIGSLKGK